MSGRSTLYEIIRNWIDVEKYTEKEFGRLADKADTLIAKNTFRWLSEAGKRHAEMLERVLTMISKDEKEMLVSFQPVALPEVGAKSYKSNVEELYYGALEHLDLELEMAKVYEQLSRTIRAEEARCLLHELSEEEESHHSAIKNLLQAFEATYPFLRR